jgi:hypothetical protein
VNVDRDSYERRKIVEEKDPKTPDEEAEVEGHARDLELGDPYESGKKDDDDVEAHALRDPDAIADPDTVARSDLDKDPYESG